MNLEAIREQAQAIIDSEKAANASYVANGPLKSHAVTAALVLTLCDRVEGLEKEIEFLTQPPPAVSLPVQLPGPPVLK